MNDIRPLASEVGILPRVHGSGLFTRGQTQVLTIATLGPVSDQQILDGIDDEETKDIFITITSRHIQLAKQDQAEVRAEEK